MHNVFKTMLALGITNAYIYLFFSQALNYTAPKEKINTSTFQRATGVITFVEIAGAAFIFHFYGT